MSTRSAPIRNMDCISNVIESLREKIIDNRLRQDKSFSQSRKMNHPHVIIEQGFLRGSIGTDIEGNKFYKFQGIPYAKPPIGELRFKAPVPPEKWTGVFDATKEGNISYSKDPLQNNKIAGSEDCLVLNVYTKKLPDGNNKNLMPVLFWIHGGGMSWGHGGEELHGPDFLITEEVVIVTINYRLGLFGLISFEDPSLDIPGNATLKDQVMALKWVQKNIAQFGGDPNNVTIFGESAGGAAVHLQMLSPMSKGLFHKAIAQSGCALMPVVNGKTGVKMLAKVMGLEDADEREIYNALMNKSKEEILEIQTKIPEVIAANKKKYLSVVVEKNSKEPFLPDEPINLLKSGKFHQVPFMIGYTSSEGMIVDDSSQQFDFESVVPYSFGYRVGSPETKIVAEEIKKFYFGDEEPSESNITKRYDLLSDCYFIYGTYVTVMTQFSLSKTPIYLYRMSIETELNFFKKFLQITTPGVSHLDDVGYLFKHFLTPEIKPGSIEDISLRRFVKLWTNFAKFGNPTPDQNDSLLNVTWKPVTGPNLEVLDIGENLVFKTENPEMERIEFWKKLFAKSPAADCE